MKSLTFTLHKAIKGDAIRAKATVLNPIFSLLNLIDNCRNLAMLCMSCQLNFSVVWQFSELNTSVWIFSILFSVSLSVCAFLITAYWALANTAAERKGQSWQPPGTCHLFQQVYHRIYFTGTLGKPPTKQLTESFLAKIGSITENSYVPVVFPSNLLQRERGQMLVQVTELPYLCQSHSLAVIRDSYLQSWALTIMLHFSKAFNYNLTFKTKHWGIMYLRKSTKPTTNVKNTRLDPVSVICDTQK